MWRIYLKLHKNNFCAVKDQLESENVVWGGYSMVQAELSGIKYLLDINAE